MHDATRCNGHQGTISTRISSRVRKHRSLASSAWREGRATVDLGQLPFQFSQSLKQNPHTFLGSASRWARGEDGMGKRHHCASGRHIFTIEHQNRQFSEALAFVDRLHPEDTPQLTIRPGTDKRAPFKRAVELATNSHRFPCLVTSILPVSTMYISRPLSPSRVTKSPGSTRYGWASQTS